MENDQNEDGVPGGYIILARKIEDSAIWSQDHHLLRFWIYLLLKARWKDTPGQRGGVTIQRGQLLKAYRVIAEENSWIENRRVRKWSTSRVARMLKWFEDREMVLTTGTELGTLITVKNFNRYQRPDLYSVTPGTEPGTDREHIGNNKKKVKKGKNPTTTHPPEVLEVFSYWQKQRDSAMGKNGGPPMQATDKRLSKIQARLREGYTLDQLKEAIDGCLSNTRNIEGGYTDIELIFRDQGHVEQYRTWHQNGPPGGNRSQPNSGALHRPLLRPVA